MILELGGRRSLALAAAFVAVVNPVSWFDSVVWGQVDSVGVVFLLLGLRELWRDRPERAALFAVVAALIKPQLGILIPILDRGDHPASVLAGPGPRIRGHRRTRGRPRARRRRRARPRCRPADAPRGGRAAHRPPDPDPDHRHWSGSSPRSCCARRSACRSSSSRRRPPFFKSELLTQIFATASGYPYLTVNAFNPWALIAGDTRKQPRQLGAVGLRWAMGTGDLRVRRGELRPDPGRPGRERGDACAWS